MIRFVFVKKYFGCSLENYLDVAPGECAESDWRLILSPGNEIMVN